MFIAIIFNSKNIQKLQSKFPSRAEWKIYLVFSGIWYSSGNLQTVAMCNKWDESQKHNIKENLKKLNNIIFRPMQILYHGYKNKQGNNEQNSV